MSDALSVQILLSCMLGAAYQILLPEHNILLFSSRMLSDSSFLACSIFCVLPAKMEGVNRYR